MLITNQEDKAHEDSLGLDAQDCGNEMRFINSYLNVDFAPNVTMRTAYMNTYPRILIGKNKTTSIWTSNLSSTIEIANLSIFSLLIQSIASQKFYFAQSPLEILNLEKNFYLTTVKPTIKLSYSPSQRV